MNQEDVELAMLKQAIETLDGDEPMEPLEWEQELREGAWLILREKPGMDREEWRQELLRQYPTEIVDTFGADPAEAYDQLDTWWESEAFENEATGIRKTYQEWAATFATPESVQVFDELARETLKNRRLSAQK